jgi:hypothetical protein
LISALPSLTTFDPFHHTTLYSKYPYKLSRFHPSVRYSVINWVAYSINLPLLGRKKPHRASHPYQSRHNNSTPLLQAHNIIHNSHPTSIYPPPQMDQLDPNLTQPQWDTGPIKSHAGYTGSNEHFGVRENVIKIKNSDGVLDHIPSEEQRRGTEEDGKFSQYELQKTRDDTYQLWMNKIGPYLGDFALGLPRRGAFLSFAVAVFFSRRFVLTTRPVFTLVNPPWKLMKFPSNYTLWVNKSGVTTDRANPRHDAYLYGAPRPHLGSRTTIFRSPLEFVPHAIWLMRGSTGQCDCKYCLPGQAQKDINRRLDHGVDLDDSDSGSVDDDDDNGTVFFLLPPPIDNPNLILILPSASSAASSSHRRGANAGRVRARRVRRDRTPPINIEIARDYRVGATDPGPSPATR